MIYQDIPVLAGGVPVLGHLAEIRRDRLAFVRRIAREVDRMARLRTVGTAVFVNHPEVVQEVLVDKARAFGKSAMTRFALYPLAGEGLFTSRGELWRRQRKLMAPMFHLGQLKTYARDMVGCSDRATAEWRDGETIALSHETTRITMSIAGKTLFDADTFTEADAIGAALTTALGWTSAHSPSFLSVGHILAGRTLTRLGASLDSTRVAEIAQRFEAPLVVPGEEGRDLRQAIGVLDARVQRMIDARRAKAMPTADLLSKLLAARDEDDGSRMSDKQVRDEVLTLFIAGHETTATGLAWAIHCLCNHPEIYAAVEREVDAIGHEPTFDDLPRLQLTLRVFKESLRLYPPVHFFSREAHEATTIQGYEIPRDTAVLISPYALHRREELYPEAERFDPDRFLPEREAKRHKLAWLPFGAGPRVCIGNHFAMMEGQLVLAALLRRARFEGLSVEVPEPGVTLRPRGGMKMRVRLRHAARKQSTDAPAML